jgi:hypothetical protein
MSVVQSSVRSKQRGPVRAEPRTPLNLRLVLGLGTLALGIGMLCLGIFHGFAHGSCSTTGYSRNYGPVPQCSKGTGWWMLMVLGGIVVTGVGAVLASRIGALLVPLVFVAIGAPFVALALGSHGHLLLNSSSGTGKVFAGVFGGCFVAAGLIWGMFAARNVSGVSGGSLLAGLLAAVVGVSAAFAIASGVTGAIGKTTTPTSVRVGSSVGSGVTVISAATERARQIALCKSIVGAFRQLSAGDKASLTAECGTNWTRAEHQLAAAERKGVLTYAAKQCVQAGAGLGLPASTAASVGRTLAAACANPGASSQGAGLKSVQAQVCVEVVKAQVPAASQPQALAACRKL